MLYHNNHDSQEGYTSFNSIARCAYTNVIRSPHCQPGYPGLFNPFDKNAMKKLLLASLLAALSAPLLAAPGGVERQQAFKKVLLQFEPMGVVVRGRDPYNKAQFITRADALKLAAVQPFALFVPNSIDAKSRAKPEIWSQPAKFKAEKDKFLQAVNNLDTAAHSGDLNAIRKNYDLVAQSCKSCHDSFRGPKV